MQTDAELFGLGKKTRKLKPGESGNEADDYTYEDVTPQQPQNATAPLSSVSEPIYHNQVEPEKVAKPFNEDATTQTQAPVSPQVNAIGSASDQVATVPTQQPTQSSSVGHDGVYNGLNREQWRDAWLSSGVNSLQGMKDWLAKNGGTLVSDNGTVLTPFGETLDLGGNARGSSAGNGVLTPSWTAVGGDAQQAASGNTDPLAALVAGAPSANTTPTTPAPGSSGVGGSLDASANDALAQLLSGQASQNVANNIESDPAVAAFKRQQARYYQNLRAQDAEEAAQNGTYGSGGFAGHLRGLAEDEAEGVSNFTGQRVAQAQQQRLSELGQALGIKLNYDQLNQQQRQFLATLDQHGDEFLRSLGLSYAQLNAQQQQAFAALQENARQANNSLGFNYDALEANQNMQALLAALRG